MQNEFEEDKKSNKFNVSDRFKGAVLDPKIDELPLKDLPWTNFEKLCAGLVEHVYKVKPRLYGEPGQNQEGIDFVWQFPGQVGEHFAEVKRYELIKKGKIRDWANKFLNGKKSGIAEEYILCVSIPIRDTGLVDEWNAEKKRLEQREIRAELWDAEDIHKILREAPKLVTRFFGEEVRQRFCVELPFPDRYPTRYRQRDVSFFNGHGSIENETCRLDAFFPTEESPKVSSILSFARNDLSGTTITISGSTLVEWAQWTAWARPDELPPYLPEVSGEKGRFILMAPSARLLLDESEVKDLRWILSEAWVLFIDSARSVEKQWRTLRFESMAEGGSLVISIGTLHRPLWNLVMDYVRFHDYEEGSSDEHIFDGRSGACIKVYAKESTMDLDAGYHLLLWGYEKGGIASRFANDSIALGWSPSELSHIEGDVWGPRHKWDAEFAHEWFFSVLLARVERWYAKFRSAEKGVFRRFVDRPTGIDASQYAWSSARLPIREVAAARTPQELLSCVHALQSHFYAYSRTVPVTKELTKHVLHAVVLLCHAQLIHDEHYVRDKLGLGDGDLAAEVENLMDGSRVKSNSSWMDLACRVLINCLEGAETLSQSYISRLHDELMPVWDRVIDDLLCERYS